jgi:hypothetical protein
MGPRRALLLAVAALLSASAALAVGILLVGDFGDTEVRILGTTGLLAAFGVLGLPATLLAERRLLPALSAAIALVAAAGAALAVAAVWSEAAVLWRSMGTAATALVAGGQVALLTARGRPSDPVSVRRLRAISTALALAVAGMTLWLIWAEDADDDFGRVFGALIVLDVLAVALQPLLARARAPRASVRVRLTLAGGGVEEAEVRGADLGAAVAAAIRGAEARGGAVERVEILGREGGAEPSPAAEGSAPVA